MLQWFANLSFRRKIALPILLLAVLLLLVGALGVHGIAQLNESNQRLGKRFLPGIALLLNADRDLYQAFVAERSLLEGHLSAEQIAGLRNDHAENLQQALDRVRQYAAMQPGEAELAKVAEFERGYALWSATSARVLSLAASDPSAAAQLSYGDSDRQFGAMREVINQLDEMEEAAAAADGEASSALGERHRWQQVALVAFGLLVCLSLVLVFPGLVTRPLQRLLQRLEEIANGDGDLRVRLEVTSRDEPGRLGSAFNAFLDKVAAADPRGRPGHRRGRRFSRFAGRHDRRQRSSDQQRARIGGPGQHRRDADEQCRPRGGAQCPERRAGGR
ncbi:chemotaxis transducer [Pseudomonas aeruginosa]|nr:chemotaxis transducer [Pseudomonas aeruginosa]